jgi:hypothetical protein
MLGRSEAVHYPHREIMVVLIAAPGPTYVSKRAGCPSKVPRADPDWGLAQPVVACHSLVGKPNEVVQGNHTRSCRETRRGLAGKPDEVLQGNHTRSCKETIRDLEGKPYEVVQRDHTSRKLTTRPTKASSGVVKCNGHAYVS